MPTERPKGLGKVVLRCAVGLLADRGIWGHLYFRERCFMWSERMLVPEDGSVCFVWLLPGCLAL